MLFDKIKGSSGLSVIIWCQFVVISWSKYLISTPNSEESPFLRILKY